MKNTMRYYLIILSISLTPSRSYAMTEDDESTRLSSTITTREAPQAPVENTAADVAAVPRLLDERIPTPAIARRHEDVYRMLYRARLVYKPNTNNDVGRIEMPFSHLPNVLDGTFDLSRCDDMGQYFHIATGFRRSKIAANENKVEVWICPRFLVEESPDADYLRESVVFTTEDWPITNPIGIFFNLGEWELETDTEDDDPRPNLTVSTNHSIQALHHLDLCSVYWLGYECVGQTSVIGSGFCDMEGPTHELRRFFISLSLPDLATPQHRQE